MILSRAHRSFLFAFLLSACGTSEPAPPTPAEPVVEPAGETEAPVEDPESEPTAPEDSADTPAAAAPEPINLLRSVPSAVAVSSAYRESAEQVARLVDANTESAWNSRTGQLQGAWIDVRLPQDVTVTAIQMTAGFTRVNGSTDLFTGNHRVRRVRVTHGGDTVAEAELDPDNRTLQTIPLEGSGGDYRIELVELVPGSREDWREVCVSELRVLGRAPAPVPVYTPRTAIGALPELAPPLDDAAIEAALDTLLDEEAMETARLFVDQAEAPGLTMGEDGEVDVIPGAERFARSPDGWVWVCARAGSSVLHGPTGEHPLPSGVRCGPLAAASDQRIWMLARDTLHTFNGSTWSVVPNPNVGRPNDLAVDGEGALWVVGETGAARLRGDAFEAVDVQGDAGAMNRVFAAGSHVVVVHDGGRLRLVEGRLVPFEITGPDGRRPPLRSMTIASNGTLVAVHNEGRALYRTRPGAPDERIALDDIEGRPQRVRALAFDRTNRLWMWADSSLTILGPDDLTHTVRHYAPGSLPELSRASLGGQMSGGVRGLYVEHNGPPLPDGETPAGRVHGRLVRNGAPLAAQTLLFCTNPMRGNLGSGYSDPCESSSESEHGFFRLVRTRADGTFDFRDAPEQETVHLVTLQSDRSWFYSPASACCARLRSGHDVDMGDIEIP
ncbi:MAG: hypothetical protein AB8I08_26010 [Sandaracinaceae bacterium]